MLKLENAKNYKREIKHLYETAFPKEERAPLFILYYKTRNEKNNFYAVVNNDEFVGLSYTIEDQGMVHANIADLEKEVLMSV